MQQRFALRSYLLGQAQSTNVLCHLLQGFFRHRTAEIPLKSSNDFFGGGSAVHGLTEKIFLLAK
jgi:hypothetical protein